MATTQYVQLPPDGVGKKVRHRLITDVIMSTVSSTPAQNAPVVGATSGASGYLTGSYSAENIVWYLRDVTGTFTSGEQLWSGGSGTGTYYGTSGIITNLTYAPGVNLIDGDTPEYSLTIDKRGAALTSFPEGTPQFDGWGHMQMSQMLAVGEYYSFVQDFGDAKFTKTLVNNSGYAAQFFKPTSSSMEYVTGKSLGDWSGRTSNQYHPYKPGVSQLIYTSIAIGSDSVNTTPPYGGTAGVVREWGYFDQFNGFGFRLDGQTMKVFLRSDVTGVILDSTTQKAVGVGNAIDYEVSQANWNVNTLNNPTSSDFVLDVTKSNLYWMDIQGTVGRIRLGVETPDGRRITCHEFRPINSASVPFVSSTSTSITGLPSCRNLSLPITWNQRNTADTGGATNAQYYMRVGAGVVFTETADVKYTGVLVHVIADDPIVLTSSTNYTPFLSFKAKNTVNGPSQLIDANLQLMVSPMISGNNYTIETLGSVNWASLGAVGTPVVGTKFTYNGVTVTGTGGAVHMNIPNSIIGIHETFDWASQGPNNLHVGIFVLPNEKWLNGYQWSESIVPGTMLYVDQSASTMAQFQYWGTAATGLAGSISGTTLTLGTGSNLLKEMFVQQPPQYASGPFGAGATVVGGVADRMKIIRQLTATGVPIATTTSATNALNVPGSNNVVLTSNSGIAAGHLVSGTGVPTSTFVESITTASPYTAVLSNSLTAIMSGTYSFYQPGATGTYQVNQSQSVALFTGYGGYYKFQPIESFVAPANGSGRAALGDRIEKSFGLGPNWNAPEDGKGVFVFAAKVLTTGSYTTPITALPTQTLMYTKYWKEIR